MDPQTTPPQEFWIETYQKCEVALIAIRDEFLAIVNRLRDTLQDVVCLIERILSHYMANITYSVNLLALEPKEGNKNHVPQPARAGKISTAPPHRGNVDCDN